MSTILHDTPRPAWATETIEPAKRGDYCMHQATLATVGPVVVRLGQVIDTDASTPEPVLAYLDDIDAYMEFGAQGCRDFAAALLKAAEVIDNA
jgi:hypothetical protein